MPHIQYAVPLVPQSSDMSCWAAGIAMILGWWNQASFDPQNLADNSGGVSYSGAYKNGLDPNDTYILKRYGLVVEYPACYTAQAVYDLLANYGPLWMASSVPGPHIRVITGIVVNSNNPDTSIVTINDPWQRGMKVFRTSNTGSSYTIRFDALMAQYEALGRSELKQPSPIYFAHMP
jgi:hypothetical protein